MSEAPSLIEERHGAVLVLTLSYPARRNALAMELRTALQTALERAALDRSVRALVLTGAGGHFCSGGDISGMEVRDALDGRERMRRTHALVRLLVLGPLPVVAAVEGWCAGAGLSLACACDHVVAAEGARFTAGFGKIGLLPDLGLPHTLPARVGPAKAREIFLFHPQLDAAEAARIGLVDAVVPAGGALGAALSRAQTLAEGAPAPVAYMKQIMGAGLDAALDAEREAQSALFLTADHREGRAAFLEKRPPRFGG